MKNSRRTSQILGVVGLLTLAAIAHADVIGAITTPTGSDTVLWSNINGVGVSQDHLLANNDYGTSGGGNKVFLTFLLPGTPPVIYQEGSHWGGDPTLGGFVSNEYMVYNDNPPSGNPPSAGPSDSITLTFNSPVYAAGVYVQDRSYGTAFTAGISATFVGGCTLCSFSNSVSSSSGNPVFVGLADYTSAAITSITISVPTSSSTNANDFAIGTLTLAEGPLGNPPGVPEPASLLLAASGLAAVVWKKRKSARA